MKTKVDPETCIGCGLCPSIAPDIYEMGDDGKAFAKEPEVSPSQEDAAQEAADGCPVDAIEIE
ncbi:ferredoxin [Oxobacter pfennigii]|uniref:Ferredoxin n=1 Tax=Oxobacter pfennigii TaxID=36849 RepID=A0A0N8NTD5_9CLOT|nr:ferredoxin [Oxobacter pfennigii]KPU44528.1 ferredoxin [Oxobacter pfennigii]